MRGFDIHVRWVLDAVCGVAEDARLVAISKRAQVSNNEKVVI